MKNRAVLTLVLSLTLGVAGLVGAGPALADHHFVLVNEVFPGTVAAPGVEAVEIKAYSPGQNFLQGHEIRTYDSAGTLLDSFPFPSDLTNSANQASYLAMTPAAETYFGVEADLEMDAATLDPSGGKACFVSDVFSVIDCVAWGDYSAGPGAGAAAVGDPVSPGGIGDGMSIVRDDGGNGLQSTDDTNDSADDFSEVAPTPKNSGNIIGNPAGRIGFRFNSYSAGEGDGMAQVSINRFGTGLPASVTVDTSDGTATDPDDYTDTSQVLDFAAGDGEEFFSFPIIDDGDEEGAETVTMTLSAPTGGAVLRSPDTKTLTINDNDGPSTLSFSKGSYAGKEGTKVIITVVRGGNTDLDVSVTFKMSNGTAESEDYQGGPFQTTLNFDGDPSGPDVTTFDIEQPLNQDKKDEPNETVELALSNPSVDAVLVAPSTATLTIKDDDDSRKPTSRVTKPAQGKTYGRGVDLVGKASDTGGSGLKRVDVALRRNMVDGSCRWWTGSRWANRSCSRKLFLRAKGKSAFTYDPSRRLPRSIGTSTRNYTVFSRAVDNAGNKQSRFVKGRNANRFEVR